MGERFKDRAELAGKVEWEGGVLDSLDYGIKTEDMPEGDTELTDLWTKMQAAWNQLSPLVDAAERLLEQAREGEDPE